MANLNDKFSALSMKDRAELINIYVKGGMMDLKEIKAHYNSLYEEKEPNKYGWGGASKEALGKAFGSASSAASSVTGIAGSAMTMVSNGMENAEINTTEADNAIEAVKSYKLDNSSLDALANSYNATPWAATDYDSSDFTKSGWEIAGNTFESTLSGITTGASVGGPWGAVIGGLAGLGSGLIGWGVGEAKAELAERQLEEQARKANRAIELNAVNTRDSILQLQANNTLRNIAADGGRILDGTETEQTTTSESPIKDFARDLAYQIITQKGVSDKGEASIGEIITGVANTNPIVDDNKMMFLYGNVNGLPPASDDLGFDFTQYIQQNYPDRDIQSYQGKINPYNEYVFDEKNKGLIEELAKKGKHIYSNADDEYVQHIQLPNPDTRNNPTAEFMDVGYRDDVHSYPLKFDVDSGGNIIAHAADLYDFNAKEYLKEYKPFKALQAHLLTSVGNPYILRQDNVPVKFIDLNGKSDYSPRVNYDGNIYDDDLTDEERRAVNFNWILKNISDEKIADYLGSGYIEPSVVEAKKANGGKLKNLEMEKL